MKVKKIFLSVSMLAIVAVIGLTAFNYASAYQGDYSKKGVDCNPERHEIMERAFGSGDFSLWKEQMVDKGKVLEKIDEEKFAKFVEARRLAQLGDYEASDALRKELGLRTSDGQKVGGGFGKGLRKGKFLR